MKRFLAIIFALAIMIPTINAKASNVFDFDADDIIKDMRRIDEENSRNSVDVPDFAQFGGDYLTFTGREDVSGKRGNYVVYGYDCSIDLNENFAEQFMNELIQNFSFQFISHDFENLIKTSSVTYEKWNFKYVGSKQVRTFDSRKLGSAKIFIPCHLSVGRSKKFKDGTTHFSITITTGLTYGG